MGGLGFSGCQGERGELQKAHMAALPGRFSKACGSVDFVVVVLVVVVVVVAVVVVVVVVVAVAVAVAVVVVVQKA